MDHIYELDERFLDAESRVTQWSVGGAMFGVTAAVVQMLIRSLIIKRNKANRRMDRVRHSDRRKSDRRIQTHHSPKHRYDFERSPIIVDDKGGVMTHVITYPYVVPIYYNYGKYDLNNLNQDYHITTTTTTTTSAPGNPWDKIEDIQLPDSFDDNIHSVFSLKNYKQYVAEKEAELHDSDYKDGVLVTSKTNDDDIQGETVENEDDYKKKTRDYLKQTYFKTFFSSNN